ncbi:MAG: cadmium-translocating P-type ATPase, partial [Gammaproteobacteria bacterium]|nr:cadmium-translocating P-type ATPase [Gammaproteobacteria bacterium]
DTKIKTRSIHLLVEGIHCAACVWLIEQHLKRLPGILKAQVNLTLKRLYLTWNNDQIKLSEVMTRLKAIGYVAVPFDQEVADERLKKHNRNILYRLAFAGFAMMNLMWISIALYSGADQGEFRLLFFWVGFCIATPTLFYSGLPFLKGAWSGLKYRHLSMDLPISIGALVTWGYSSSVTVIETITGRQSGDVYFDTVVNFIFVILIGRYLEALSKRKAVISTQRLLNLQPKIATQVLTANEEKVVPVASLKPDDIVKVKPGGLIPVDGIVTQGQCDTDESMLTGESTSVNKTVGSNVSAGTLNKNGVIFIQVKNTLKNTALGKIVSLVEQAQGSKAPIQCIADRVVPWFVSATLSLATISFLYWISTDIELAILTATSVLIITCPCAFGLATPMSIAVATGMAAKLGILVRNGEVLERLSNIKHYVFDKTGTLTYGNIGVETLTITDPTFDVKNVLALAYSLEQHSEHPIAEAICSYAKQHQSKPLAHEEFKVHQGLGVSALINKQLVKIGSVNWLAKDSDLSGVCLSVDGTVIAEFIIQDQLRPEATRLVRDLSAEGIKLTMLSGDSYANANQIAQQLMSQGGHIDVIAEVLPQDKDQAIQQLQNQGEEVVMIGDGINDAPALVRANVGMAMGTGTDVSIASSDIVLLGGDLDKVHIASNLSKRTIKTIYQNIGLSISYNIIMVPLAMMAYVSPLVAAISMPISSLLVIGNAARLRTLKNNK